MKQRKKQPEVTRQAILDAAGAAFSARGYAATGIGTIVAATGLTKGALFHHFPDKRALALAWIRGDLAGAVSAHWIQPLERIDSLTAFRSFCRERCLGLDVADATSALVALAAETGASDPAMGAALGEVVDAWRSALAGVLERGKSGGWIHPSIQPAVEAGILVCTFSGFSVAFKCNGQADFRHACASGLEGYLETLRPQ
jgi:TetR/AcrR family transcriptional repressor of nem operon